MWYLRIFVLPMVLVWMFIVAWDTRATGIGPDLTGDVASVVRLLAVFFFFRGLVSGALLIPLLWLGTRWRVYVTGVMLSLLLPLLAAEAIARYEEWHFVRTCKTNPSSLHIHAGELYDYRWWPNDDNMLFYNPATGELIDGN